MNVLIKQFPSKSILWSLKEGSIIDEPADVLICSANVSLNLSGGVGADLLGRYGTKMQRELHQILKNRSPKVACQGEVFTYTGRELPYKAVLHAVAVDGWYHSTVKVLEEIIEKSLREAVKFNARKVALTALATGYGDLTIKDFSAAIKPLLNSDYQPINEICVCLMDHKQLVELSDYLF
ncbi:MAG TPA: macro domain-containing protein [Verrucomicrobiae bacterium]|jgi:O-acetyl-ADP-ribose deacetylase (regulator of RNase III)